VTNPNVLLVCICIDQYIRFCELIRPLWFYVIYQVAYKGIYCFFKSYIETDQNKNYRKIDRAGNFLVNSVFNDLTSSPLLSTQTHQSVARHFAFSSSSFSTTMLSRNYFCTSTFYPHCIYFSPIDSLLWSFVGHK
jgi:hypothetical protein